MKFYLSMFCFIILKTNVESAILDIKPGTIIKAGDPSLTIKCQPSPGEVSKIYKLDIQRNNSGTDDTIGFVVENSPLLSHGYESPKYTVTGSMQDSNSVSTAFVQIVIQEPTCIDKGQYVCRVVGDTSHGRTITPKSRSSVTFQENPSNINTYITPEYNINTTITMTCNGNVGNPRKTWQWQTRRFPASTQWVQLTDGVIDGDVTPPTGASCSYRQQTNLTYTVTSQDEGLQIRCILDNTEEFSGNFTINLALPDTSSVSTSPTTSSVDRSGCAKQFRVTDTTTVTVLGVLVALHCCFFI